MTARRNPPAVPADTSPEVWRRQMALVAATPVEERIVAWEALYRAGAEMEEAAVRRRHPEYDDLDVHLALVRLREVRGRLASRSERQWQDSVEIAATQTLDRAYPRRWAGELGVVDDLAELLDGRGQEP